MKNKAVRQYLAQLKRGLLCSADHRRRFLSQGETLLAEFLEENPQARYGDLTQAFGQPENLATEMLSQLDPIEVNRVRRQRKIVRWGIVVLFLLALALTTVFWYGKWVKDQEVINGDFYIVEEDVVVVTKDDYNDAIKRTSPDVQSHKGG